MRAYAAKVTPLRYLELCAFLISWVFWNRRALAVPARSQWTLNSKYRRNGARKLNCKRATEACALTPPRSRRFYIWNCALF